MTIFNTPKYLRNQITYIFLLFTTLLYFSQNLTAQKFDVKFSEEESEFIKNHPVIEFGYEPQWEPYEIYEDGEYKGIVGEYVKILERETGITFKPIPNLSWKKSIEGLKSGEIKMVPCCAVTPDREKFLEFTDVYINDPMVIIVRKDFQYVGSLDDLEEKTIALPQNYYTVELISQNHKGINVILKDDIQQCMEAVSFGEADAFVDNLAVVSFYMNNKGFSNLKIAAPTPYKSNGIALATTKDFVVLRNIAQKVFDKIPLSEQSHIRQKWISNEYLEKGYNKRLIILTIIYVVLFLLVIGVLYYWIKVLRNQISLRKESEAKLLLSLEEIKKQDNEKKVLLQEIHHRVKNNLQIVSSMMRLQVNASKDEKSIKTLEEAVERIKTIALVHDKIYKSPNLSEVTLGSYLNDLVNDILKNYDLNNNVKKNIESNDVALGLNEIVPLGLIINELVSNSIKYALPQNNYLEISVIIFNKSDNLVELVYADNGNWIENEESDYFGTSLIEIFSEQLDGNYQLYKNKGQTKYVFEFRTEN